MVTLLGVVLILALVELVNQLMLPRRAPRSRDDRRRSARWLDRASRGFFDPLQCRVNYDQVRLLANHRHEHDGRAAAGRVSAKAVERQIVSC